MFPGAGTKAQMSVVIGPVFGWNWEGRVLVPIVNVSRKHSPCWVWWKWGSSTVKGIELEKRRKPSKQGSQLVLKQAVVPVLFSV